MSLKYSSSLCPDSKFQGHCGFYVSNYEMLPTDQLFLYNEIVQNQIWEEMPQNAHMAVKSVTLQLLKIFISVWYALAIFERCLI